MMANVTRDSRGPLLTILLLAALLYSHKLTFHSIELDEAVSLNLAAKPLTQLLHDQFNLLDDPHPPLYYTLLKFWTALWGRGEVAARGFSALAGLLLTALLYRLGARLGGRPLGLTAALLAALSPWLVWHAQEVRMYAWLAVFCTAGLLAFVEALLTGDRRWWVAFALAEAAACYTHLAGAFLLPVYGLALLGLGLAALRQPHWRRSFWAGCAALAAFSLIYLPHARLAWQSGGGGAVLAHLDEALPFTDLLKVASLSLTTHQAIVSPAGQKLVWLNTALLLGLGLVLGWRQKATPRWALVLLFACILTPLLAIYFVSLGSAYIFFHRKILAVLTPAFFITLALGIVGLARAWRGVGGRSLAALALSSLLAIQVFGLTFTWRAGLHKEDWRAAARYLETHAGSNDAILVHLHFMRIPLDYYYRGEATILAPFGSQVDHVDQVSPTLQTLADHDTVWLALGAVDVGDPQGIVEGWFRQRYPLVTEVYPIKLAVKGYALKRRLAALPANATPIQATFGDKLALRGYRLDTLRTPASDWRLHPPSAWIHVTLYWQALAPLDDDFRVRPYLSDWDGRVWGGPLERPNEPFAFEPPSTWPTGVLIRDEYDVNLNPKTPPGPYNLTVQVFADDGAPWPASGAGAGQSWLVIQPVEVLK